VKVRPACHGELTTPEANVELVEYWSWYWIPPTPVSVEAAQETVFEVPAVNAGSGTRTGVEGASASWVEEATADHGVSWKNESRALT